MAAECIGWYRPLTRSSLVAAACMCKSTLAFVVFLVCALDPAFGYANDESTLPASNRSERSNSDTVEPLVLDENDRRPEKLQTQHLPNAVRVHERVISGGMPEGDAAFAELQQLGIKTVISVDGAKPDLEMARKYGLKYVHIPHSYDGVPEQQAQQLARAVQVFDGPIFIHCHHGKHRSPAAAAVACVSAGLIEPSSALAVLTTAGTSPDYRGLYQSAESARRIDQSVLDMLPREFPEVAVLPEMAEAMVGLEHTFDRMKLVAAADWRTPDSHPDVDPSHEALLLKEHFAELVRKAESERRPVAFVEMMRSSQESASELEAALREWQNDGRQQPVPARFAVAFKKITSDCKSCHTQFRDVPLSEKSK